jgi:hypothetical protein
MNCDMSRHKLKIKELNRIFEPIEGEIALITASAKFDFNLRKTTEDELQTKLACIEDITELARLLKTRLTMLWTTTG